MKQLIVTLLSLAATVASCMAETPFDFRSAENLPVTGTLAPDATARYSRLPDSLENNIRKDLWSLGLNSAGLALRFRSDSPRIAVRWHSRNKFNMNHMTITGIRGLDLYTMTPDSCWTFVNSARPSIHKHNSESKLVENMNPGVEREYMLFLSLYDGVDSIYIGVDSAATLEAPAVNLPLRDKPVVMYGTSILQGGCATRPGMAHTNILQRELNREVINLGFSGNAKLDPEIARLMATADASVYVVDALPNCTPEAVTEKMPAFLEILRNAHPDTPILLVESPWFPIMRFNNEVAETLTEKNRRLRTIYDTLAPTDHNLYYFDADNIFADDTESTVDNYHMTDKGFCAFADRLLPVLRNIIENK